LFVKFFTFVDSDFNMKTDKIILFFFVFILPFCVFGQKNDSLSLKYDSIRVISFSIQKIDTTIHQEINTVNIDTNLNYFQYNDPIRKAYLFNSNVGNTGLASGSRRVASK